MQVEAKKAFEEYELYEEMRNGIKVRAKVSNVERGEGVKELIADTGAIYTAIPEDILKDLGIGHQRKLLRTGWRTLGNSLRG